MANTLFDENYGATMETAILLSALPIPTPIPATSLRSPKTGKRDWASMTLLFTGTLVNTEDKRVTAYLGGAGKR